MVRECVCVDTFVLVSYLKYFCVLQTIGGFTNIGDLNCVPGVGQSVLDLNRGRLTCYQSKRANR